MTAPFHPLHRTGVPIRPIAPPPPVPPLQAPRHRGAWPRLAAQQRRRRSRHASRPPATPLAMARHQLQKQRPRRCHPQPFAAAGSASAEAASAAARAGAPAAGMAGVGQQGVAAAALDCTRRCPETRHARTRHHAAFVAQAPVPRCCWAVTQRCAWARPAQRALARTGVSAPAQRHSGPHMATASAQAAAPDPQCVLAPAAGARPGAQCEVHAL